MPNTLGDMVVRIVGDNAELDKSIDKSQAKLDKFGKSATKVGKSLTKFVTLPLLALAGGAVKASADMEMLEASFTTMLGSAAAARDMLQELTDLAARTPFQLTELGDATKTMLAFGIATEDVLPYLQQIGDISGGNAEKLRSITLAFSQIQSTGRLMGQDLLQLINAGFNPLQSISEKTGESMAELKKRMEAGAISAEEVAGAFKDATSEGGRFFGGMERASQTLVGQFSTLKDNIVATARSFGDILLPTVKNIVSSFTDLTKRFTDLAPRTKRIILNFAAFAAAAGPLLLIVGKTVTTISALKTAMIALNLTMATNPVFLLVSGLAALVAITAIVVKSTGLLRSENERYAEQLQDTIEEVKNLSLAEQKLVRARLLVQQAELEEKLAASIKKTAEISAARDEVLKKSNALQRQNTGDAARLRKEIIQQSRAMTNLQTDEADLVEKSKILNKALGELNTSIEELEVIEQATKDTEDLAAATALAAAEAKALADDAAAKVAALEAAEAIREQTQALADLSAERRTQREIEEQEYQAVLTEEREKRDAAAAAYQAILDKEEEIAEARRVATADRLAADQGYDDYVRVTQEQLNAAFEVGEQKKTEDLAIEIQKRKDLWAGYAQVARKITSDLTNAIINFNSSLTDALIADVEATVESEVERDEQIRAIRRKEAKRNKLLGAFNVGISTAEAVMKYLAAGNLGLSIAAGVAGVIQLAAILAKPLPALATGGIVPSTPGGQPIIAGEGGSAEAVVPLDRLSEFISELPAGISGGGDMRIVVNLDGQPILDTVAAGTQSRNLIIDSRAVV